MKYFPNTHTFSQKADKPGFFTIALQFSRDCNYHCRHCSENDYLKELPSDDLRRIIDNISESGVKRVNISGGEPTFRDDWLDLLDYLSTKNLNVSLATNCSHLDLETLTRIKSRVSNLRVSIYGQEEIHDQITDAPGSFRKIREIAELSSNLGIPVYACMAVMRTNLEQISKVHSICRDLGMEKLLIYSLVPKGRGAEIYSQDSVSREEVQNALTLVPRSRPEIFWSPFDKDGICALIQADGSLVATPYKGDKSRIKLIGYPLTTSLQELWYHYPFKENYLDFNGEKMKC